MKRKPLVLTLVVAGLVLVATAAAFNVRPSDWFAKDRPLAMATTGASTPAVSAPAPAPAALPPGVTPNYRAIVQQSGPAVVGVTVAGLHRLGPGELQLDLSDPFFEFFRGLPGFELRAPGLGRGGNVPFRSQASGFIISSDGVILTNAHVVREAKEVVVKLSDRREFKAKVLGSDVATDVAVLRIDAKNLPAVRLGDPRQLQVGDPVLAIGSPFGFEQSATQGIVSAKGRSLPGDTAVPFIQTDAAVNPGNSGGPLFDGSGAVVGINAQIYSQSGGYQGLSFAIPIDVALRVKDQILASGRASHARLGVKVQDVDRTLAESFGLSQPDGARIAEVSRASAADGAGLLAGDVITEINGEPIARAADLSSRIARAAPGDTVRLKVWRDRAAREMQVKLGRAEDDAKEPSQPEPAGPAGGLGLSLRALTAAELAKLQLSSGLRIEAVSGPAARAGLMPGDVLLAINGLALKTPDEARRLLQAKPKSVALLILRGGARIFVPVELD